MLEFTTEITVELRGIYGSDLDICTAAWVSSGTDTIDTSEKRQRGLINKLLKDKHGTPFEEGYLSVRIDAPRAVRDEHVRHRIGSYSSSSLRYREGPTRLYVPPQHRPLKKVEGFKQIQPVYEPLSDHEYQKYVKYLQGGYQASYDWYFKLKDSVVDTTEALRWLTHDGLMTPYIARFNPRMVMSFLSLRTHDERANHISFPMWEIAQVADQIESFFSKQWPYTYEAFNTYGREAP
jgi:thymidylate synthase (FAD)